MTNQHQMQMQKDLQNKKLTLTRQFDADPATVWRAWTEAELLDQWWAPKPWRAETKSMDFREGGHWLYAMVSPQDERHYSISNYATVNPGESFGHADAFCDADGNKNADMPSMYRHNTFSAVEGGTQVKVVMTFDDIAHLQGILDMGFEQGMAMAMGNLDQCLSRGFSQE